MQSAIGTAPFRRVLGSSITNGWVSLECRCSRSSTDTNDPVADQFSFADFGIVVFAGHHFDFMLR